MQEAPTRSVRWVTAESGGAIRFTLLDLGAPIILLMAAAWAFCRGYATSQRLWWHGAGTVLVVLTVATLIGAN